jgi:regulator of sigma E protease
MNVLTSLGQSVITLVIFALMLGILVVVHELGHFIAARLAGVRVLEFGIGFPPRARILRSTGDTLYTLNWLPIGGFVKLEGEEGVIEGEGQQREVSVDPRSFAVAWLPTKLLILVAGVTMNLLLAFVILTGIAWLANPTLGLTFGAVQTDSPASRAGLVPGDTIVAVDGAYFDMYVSPSIVEALRSRAGDSVTLTVRHADGSTADVPVTLRPPGQIDSEHGALGITTLSGKITDHYLTHDLPTAIELGVVRTRDAFGLIIDGLRQLADSIVNHPTEAPPVQGPVGIAVGVGDVFWQQGPIATLALAGLLSANLALVNVLPIPPLDGGRMLVLVIRAAVGRRLSIQAERLTYFVGFGFLMIFLVWITFFDIARQVGGGQ